MGGRLCFVIEVFPLNQYDSHQVFDPCQDCQKGVYYRDSCSVKCKYGIAMEREKKQRQVLEQYVEILGGKRPKNVSACDAAVREFQEGLYQDKPKYSTESVMQGIIALKEKVKRNTPLTVEQLQKLAEFVSKQDAVLEDKWVWIEVLLSEPEHVRNGKKSAYYKVQPDYTRGRSFCCGYPGISYGFDFDKYGETWLAFLEKPDIIKPKVVMNRGQNVENESH